MAKKVELTTFRQMFTILTFGLRLNGVYPGPKTLPVKVWRLLNALVAVSAIVIVVYTMIVDIGDRDYEDACRQMSIAVLLITALIKLTNLMVHEERIVSIIEMIDADYARPDEIVSEYATSGVWIQRVWTALIVSTGQIFVSAPLLLTAHSYLYGGELKKYMIFDCILPWGDRRKYDTPVYELFGLYECYINVSVVMLFASFDTMMPIFVLHLCGRLERVADRIRSLHARPETNRRLAEIVRELQIIYKLAVDINIVSGFVYDAIFLFSSLLTTASGYQIISCIKSNKVPYEFTMFFVATIFHTFIPCYYGNLMIEKGLSICSAAYESCWESVPDLSSRKTLHIIIMRAQKPLAIYTNFHKISLVMFTNTIRNSWTLFNLLLAMFK